MSGKTEIVKVENLESRILSIREKKVMLDSDLARIYGVTTTRLNQQFSRNRNRFPVNFAFQLTTEEFADLISQTVTSKKGRGGRRKLPWVFTEHGAIMLASILNSERAVEMSIFVVEAFVQMRAMLMGNHQLAAKLNELEKHVADHDGVIAELFAAIRQLLNPPEKPRREIGFHVHETPVRYRIKRKRF